MVALEEGVLRAASKMSVWPGREMWPVVRMLIAQSIVGAGKCTHR